MKVSENWLREWVQPKLTTQALADQLTMAGLEIEGFTSNENAVIFEVNVTPNRGDCLSVLGIARELSVLNKIPLLPLKFSPVVPTHEMQRAIKVEEPAACPRYIGRLIKAIDPAAVTPTFIQEKLQQCEMNLIHPVVDILNYVMLELGQPMHAFDADKLQGCVTVRQAHPGEKIAALGEQEIALVENALVIADERGAQAIAGIIGGAESAVSSQTTNVFLESALFTMERIAGKARQMGLHTDSSYRFERGVDPELQALAMERATQLIVEYCKGQAGPMSEYRAEHDLPRAEKILFRAHRFDQIIGDHRSDEELKNILERLQCQVIIKKEGWEVLPPSFRYDLKEEIDLIEELARIIGYSEIKASEPTGKIIFNAVSQGEVIEARVKRILVDLGYQEAITYSFVDEQLQRRLFPMEEGLALVNPISSDMGVMRLSTWTGLLNVVQYNQYRQQHRLKFFEIGQCFRNGAATWENYLGGVVCGEAFVEHWGMPKRKVDFYDVKGHVETLFKTLGLPVDALGFEEGNFSACHPGQCAQITWHGKVMGVMGKLHPQVQKEWDLQGPIYLFELALAPLQESIVPIFARPSKFPENRRDIAVIVKETISGKNLVSSIRKHAGELLQDVIVFDVYNGKGIEPGQKSVAMGLILQHPSRTLVDQEIDNVVQKVVTGLREEFNAKLRD